MTKFTILVVEDNTEIVKVEKDLLEAVGYRVCVAFSAQEAVSILRSEHVDLVFSDIRLGRGENGIWLAEQVSNLYPHMPVVLTTGYASAVPLDEALPWLIIPKPYRIEQLQRAFEGMLNP